MSAQITGRVVISPFVPRLTGGVVRIELEQVNYADARATVVARTAVSGIEHDPGDAEGRGDGMGTVIPFTLTVSGAIEPGYDYSIRAWLDREGDLRPGRHHARSDRSYPVLTRGFGSDVTVRLDPVVTRT